MPHNGHRAGRKAAITPTALLAPLPDGSVAASETDPFSDAQRPDARIPPTSSLGAGCVAQTLDSLRRAIDAIDAELVKLLARRGQIVAEIAALKAETATPALAPDRERAVLARVSKLNPGPFPDHHLRAIFHEIISASRSLEEPERVAYLGPPYTFSHQAAQRRFGHSASFVPLGSFRDIFDHVDRGEEAYGVVPIENSTSGTIGETLDLLFDRDLHVFGEIVLPISHNLLASEVRAEYAIVYSHAQALHQCRDWLARNMPAVPTAELTSTAQAARRAASEPGAAAIGPLSAAEAYELLPIQRNIQDVATNRTRFYVIAKRPAPRTGNDKTALVLAVHNRIGALHDILGIIRDNQIDLSFIQSRPSRTTPGEYLFFLELAGHPDDDNVTTALGELREACILARVLGAWPADHAELLPST